MMNQSPILLSISMLVSGREEMEKSLNSLLSLKNAFPTEIILVDTGCNSEQRTLAKKYADKIIDFAWCNDFAAARNAGLKEARGKWFLYLDDDEWFEDTQEIIRFFTTEEYKNYRCASYVVRNYVNLQGTMYEDSYPSRMVKLEKETKFVGKIHEYLTPFRLPKKEFHDYVHHYGYAFNSEEAREEHAKRNFRLLHELVKENPGEPRWSCQLAQEYYAAEEYEATVHASVDGLEELELRRSDKDYAPAYIGALYAYILFSLELLGKNEEEEKWLKKAFADSDMKFQFMKPTLAFFCQAAARLYGNMGNYQQCAAYLGNYLEYEKQFGNDRAALEDGAAAITTAVFQDNILYGVILKSMESVIRVEDYKLAEEAFYRIDWSKRMMLRQNKWERKMLDACCSVPYHPLWSRIMQTLVGRNDGIKEMYVVFLETEIAYKQHGDQEKLARLYRIAASLTYEHRYLLGCQILWTVQNPEIMDETERKQKLEELFAQLFGQYAEELFEVKTEIWNAAERMEISMEDNLLQLDCRMWKGSLENWIREATEEKLEEWGIRIAKWRTVQDIRYEIFNVKCLEGYLISAGIAKLPLQAQEERILAYADAVIGMYAPYYQENAFTEAFELLPEELQLALGLQRLREFRQKGDAKSALRQIKECLSLYPPLDAALSVYAELLKEEIQKELEQQNSDKAELEKLAATLKTIAKQYLERGEREAAEEILRQIQICVSENIQE